MHNFKKLAEEVSRKSTNYNNKCSYIIKFLRLQSLDTCSRNNYVHIFFGTQKKIHNPIITTNAHIMKFLRPFFDMTPAQGRTFGLQPAAKLTKQLKPLLY